VIIESAAGCSEEVDVRHRKRKTSRDYDGDDGHDDDRDDRRGSGAPAGHPFGWNDPKEQHGDAVEEGSIESCLQCHTVAREDKGQPMSCFRCHGQEWEDPATGTQPEPPPSQTPGTHAFGWTDPRDQHPDRVDAIGVSACMACHTIDRADAGQPMSCYNCHGQEWEDPATGTQPEPPPSQAPGTHAFGWTDPRRQHPSYVERNGVADCLACHSTSSQDRGQPMSCYNCHGQEW
jgi:hypothetical protein